MAANEDMAPLVSDLAAAGAPLPASIFVPVPGTPAEADAVFTVVRDRLEDHGISYSLTGDGHRTALTVTRGRLTYTLAHVRNGDTP